MGQSAVRSQENDGVGWLMEAMARMVRPIVRFAVGRVSCAALVNLIREIYVMEAREYLKAERPDRKVTRSALALLCGMDGRAIQFFEECGDQEYSSSDVSSPGLILEMWSKDEAFCDPETGQPAELLIHGPHGTFQRLVSRAAGRAVTPQTALEKLLESGNVELDDEAVHVRLIDPFYQPVKASEKTAIEAGSLAIRLLGKAVVHNTSKRSPNQPSWLQQDRWSYRIPLSRLDEIREDIRAVLLRHIHEVEACLEKEEKATSEGAECSVGVGWYYWEEPSHIDIKSQDRKHIE